MKYAITMLLALMLIAAPAHARGIRYELYVKYWCGWQYVTAMYSYKSLGQARRYQQVFRNLGPRYRDTWIRVQK